MIPEQGGRSLLTFCCITTSSIYPRARISVLLAENENALSLVSIRSMVFPWFSMVCDNYNVVLLFS